MPTRRGTRTNDSMGEFLTGLLQDVAYAMTLPDADMNYLGLLQQALIQKVREPMESYLQSQGAGGMGPQMMGQQMMGGMQPPAGVRPATVINPDELRRTISQAQIGGL